MRHPMAIVQSEIDDFRMNEQPIEEGIDEIRNPNDIVGDGFGA